MSQIETMHQHVDQLSTFICPSAGRAKVPDKCINLVFGLNLPLYVQTAGRRSRNEVQVFLDVQLARQIARAM